MTESTRFSITKLNNENYQVWKFKVELLLIKEELWEQVTSNRPTDAETVAVWKKRDDKARAIIGLLVEDSQLTHIRKAETSKELHESGNMEEHINVMSDLVEKLTALGEELMDHLVVAMLLSSLPDSYSTLITALESRSEVELTLDLVKGKLLDEYRRRRGITGVDRDVNSALKVTQRHNTSTNQDTECYFCKNKGHYKRDCKKYARWKAYKEKKEGKEKVHRVTESTQYQAAGLRGQQVTDTEGNSSHVCFIIHKSGNNSGWYIDSGASSHMTSNKDFFKELIPKTNTEVTLANGNTAKALGIGSGEITCINEVGKEITITLKDVLYVPELQENLISVKVLAQRGYALQFEGRHCKINKNGAQIAVAVLSQHLYELKLKHKAMLATDNQHTKNCQHIWHRRFGHRHPDAIRQLQDKKLVTDIKIEDCGIRETCEHCITGKLTRTSFPKESISKTNAVLDLVHTDICGPMQTQTPGKKRYFMTIIDDFSRYTEIYFLENKSEAAARIKEYIQYVRTKFGRIPKIIRSDNGKEFVNNYLKQLYKEEGIQMQLTATYSPQQNGIAERKNRTLMEAARCMLFDADMKTKYWAEAVSTANYLQNILPTRAITKTPFELWNQKKAKVDHLKIFGCKGYIHIPKEKRQKLDQKALPLTFVGYSRESKAYRMLNQETNKITISRDVAFIEDMNNVKYTNKESIIKGDGTMVPQQTKKGKHEEGKEDVWIQITSEEVREQHNDAEVANSEQYEEAQTGDQEPILISDDSVLTDRDESYRYSESDEELPIEPTRSSKRPTRGVPPDRYQGTVKLATVIASEPKNRQEAITGPDKEAWMKAMDEEMESLSRNQTWKLAETPTNKRAIGCKWVFKRKINQETGTTRYKARLVAQGFSQRYGTDYDEVFAPVVRPVTFRLLLTISGKRNLHIYHYDAKTAFLNGKLQETIYMNQPEGYEEPGKGDMTCQLTKSIYGLKQAAKVWNEMLHTTLSTRSFKQSIGDPCLYIKKYGEISIYVTIYVDDILIACKKEELILKIASELKKEFSLSSMGKLGSYLGMKVERDHDGIYKINQEAYIEEIIKKYNLQDAKPSKIPLDPGYMKTIQNGEEMERNDGYQSLMGALLYVAVHTRPDIAASVSILSQQIKQPSTVDWTEAKRVVRYLKGTKHLYLKLGGIEPSNLIGYADADWAENKRDRKSNSGFLFKYNGGVIAWACRKQSCVTLSTTEAEYVALAEASQEAIWIRRLLDDFEERQTTATTMYEDNQSCLKLITNKRHSNRTKHIDTKYHFLRDLAVKGIINPQYCPTEDMIADLLTKPLGPIKLEDFREQCKLIG